MMDRDAALGARNHFILDTDIGKSAAHHDLVVAPARPIGIEILATHLVLREVLACRAIRLDGTGRRYVVGCN